MQPSPATRGNKFWPNEETRCRFSAPKKSASPWRGADGRPEALRQIDCRHDAGQEPSLHGTRSNSADRRAESEAASRRGRSASDRRAARWEAGTAKKMPPLSKDRHAEAERFPLMKTRICGRGFEAKSPERIRSGKMPLKLSLGRRRAVVSDAHDSPEILMSIPALGPRAASSCSAGAPAAPMRAAE